MTIYWYIVLKRKLLRLLFLFSSPFQRMVVDANKLFLLALLNFNGLNRILLWFSLFENELRMDVPSRENFQKFLLSFFWKNVENLMSIIGRNCTLNKALGNLFDK